MQAVATQLLQNTKNSLILSQNKRDQNLIQISSKGFGLTYICVVLYNTFFIWLHEVRFPEYNINILLKLRGSVM